MLAVLAFFPARVVHTSCVFEKYSCRIALSFFLFAALCWSDRRLFEHKTANAIIDFFSLDVEMFS